MKLPDQSLLIIFIPIFILWLVSFHLAVQMSEYANFPEETFYGDLNFTFTKPSLLFALLVSLLVSIGGGILIKRRLSKGKTGVFLNALLLTITLVLTEMIFGTLFENGRIYLLEKSFHIKIAAFVFLIFSFPSTYFFIRTNKRSVSQPTTGPGLKP